MKLDRSYDYLFSSFADAIILGTLLVSAGRYISPYYFVYLIVAILLILIGLELYKYSTNQEPPHPVQTVDLQKQESVKIKQSRKASPFQLKPTKKTLKQKKPNGSNMALSGQETQGPQRASKWEAVRKSVVSKEPLTITFNESLTKSSQSVLQEMSSDENQVDGKTSPLVVPLTRAKKLRKSVRKFVLDRTMSLYTRSKARLSSNEKD